MQNVIYNSYEGEVSKTNELQLKVTLPDNLIMAAKIIIYILVKFL